MIDVTQFTDEELLHVEMAFNLYITHLHDNAFRAEAKNCKWEIYDPAKQEAYKARAQAFNALENTIKKAIEIYTPILAEYDKRYGILK